MNYHNSRVWDRVLSSHDLNHHKMMKGIACPIFLEILPLFAGHLHPYLDHFRELVGYPMTKNISNFHPGNRNFLFHNDTKSLN